MTNDAAERLLAELQENPLPGARHSYTIVRDRLPKALAAERLGVMKALFPWTSHTLRCNLSFPEDIVVPGRWVCTCGLTAILDAEVLGSESPTPEAAR